MPSLAMRKLGKKGRFGNQLFQYARLRQEAGDQYQCGSWVGQELFGLSDPAITSDTKDIGTGFPLQSGWYDKALFKSWYKIKPCDELDAIIEANRQHGPLVGVHLRRGDYGTFRRKSARWCFVAPVQWYVEWIVGHIQNDPIVFIASDDPDISIPEFRTFKHAAGMWADFYTLTKCDYLLISNSTFSFAASMLSTVGKEFWRPRLSLKSLIPYDPWDAPLVFKDELYEA